MFNFKKDIFNRYTALLLIMVLISGILLQRLFLMQVVEGELAKSKADSYSIKDLAQGAPRGEILDKNGQTLATSVASYDLIYSESSESQKKFFQTFAQVLSILEQNGEEFYDKFALKLDGNNNFYFDFQSGDQEVTRLRELRWKKDRGMDDYIFRKSFGKSVNKSSLRELTKEEEAALDEIILSYSPDKTFEYLINRYDIYDILGLSDDAIDEIVKKGDGALVNEILAIYSKDLIRKFMVVKDEVALKLFQADKTIKISSNISKQSAFIFMQKSNVLPGVDVRLNPIRIYPYGTLASHILGYISPIDEFSQEDYEGKGYDVNTDLVGTYGIESYFENELKGNKTISTVKVDRQGRIMQELFRLEGYPGNNIELSIDKNLQYTAEKALEANLKELQTSNSDHGENKSSKNATRGAVVVMDVKTGKVLALASYPSFDPNVFVMPGKLTDDLYEKYFDPNYEAFGKELIKRLDIKGKKLDDLFPLDENGKRYDYYDLYPKPFFNYATQGLSPVGSIFKPFTALAGLEEGVIDKNTVINDTGYYEREELKGYRAENNEGVAWGNINLKYALTVSSNYFFLETGWRLYNKVGLNSIAKWSWKLGLGQDPKDPIHSTTGIEIDENVYGNVYNFDSRKEYLSQYAYYYTNNTIKSGVARSGSSFRPIDISIKEGDSEKVKKIKADFKKTISDWFLNLTLEERPQNELYTQFYDISFNYMNQLLNEIPENERNNYETADYYAEQIASVLVYDRVGELYTPVNVMNSAIGQGDSQLTILQIANALATMVNGGTRYKTSLVNAIKDPDGNLVRTVEPEVLDKVDIKLENLKLIKDGMYNVNNTPEGSGYIYFNEYGNEFPIKTGGKTGTAEYKSYGNEINYMGRHQYGTYITFAPFDEPEIVIATIVYDSVHGSYTIPISKAIYEEYFRERIKKSNPDYKFGPHYLAKPVIKLDPSQLKLKNKDPLLTEPQIENYVPGMEVGPFIVPEDKNKEETTTSEEGGE